MRRRDREVTNRQEIIDIISRCDTVRLGIQGDKYPYIVPVSFGFEVIGGNPAIYFHCAQQGLKLDLLNKNPDVCVEGDIFVKIEPITHGITTRYESFIGFGKCNFLTDTEEIKHGLHRITEHYGYPKYSLEKCKGLEHLLVGKIALETVTGKRNL